MGSNALQNFAKKNRDNRHSRPRVILTYILIFNILSKNTDIQYCGKGFCFNQTKIYVEFERTWCWIGLRFILLHTLLYILDIIFFSSFCFLFLFSFFPFLFNIKIYFFPFLSFFFLFYILLYTNCPHLSFLLIFLFVSFLSFFVLWHVCHVYIFCLHVRKTCWWYWHVGSPCRICNIC